MKNSDNKKEITFDSMPKALAEVYDEVYQVKKQLSELLEKFEPKTPKEYLTRSEVSEMLKVDKSTLWLWQQKGKLIPYGLGNRVYYLRTDIVNALILLGNKKGTNNV